jgi:queuine tRNA-ribosyltransferase
MRHMLSFEVSAVDAQSAARAGRLSLRSGTVETPVFMPVGTRATVRGLTPEQLRATGSRMVLGNTYHLAMRPGAELIAEQGGLHAFMAWDGPMLTDSGGYQVFSLAEHRRMTEDGVQFRSPVDGARLFLGPREAMRVQNLLGADVAMVFDHCAPWPCSREDATDALERTIRWSAVCKDVHDRADDQALFGIVQGGVYEDLRGRSAAETVALDFPGYAIGGVSVGEDEALRRGIVEVTAPLLPPEKPRYLMGVGFPEDIVHAIGCGVDMFDCVAPTRMGRTATAFTWDGRLRMRNAAMQRDARPVQEGCSCYCCRVYSRAYVHHLFRVGEMLGPVLLSIHNLTFYADLTSAARDAVQRSRFTTFKDEFSARYRQGESRS